MASKNMSELDNQVNKIIDELVKRRKELKLSQRALAERCGMTQSSIGNIERHSASPKLETICLIADKLNYNIHFDDRLKSKWDGTTIRVYWKNELTAIAKISGNNVFIHKFTNNIIKQFFYAYDKMNLSQLSELMETRCWERERRDIGTILRRLGIQEYDPIEIVQKTFGVSYNDSIWFNFFDIPLTWEKVRPRRYENV